MTLTVVVFMFFRTWILVFLKVIFYFDYIRSQFLHDICDNIENWIHNVKGNILIESHSTTDVSGSTHRHTSSIITMIVIIIVIIITIIVIPSQHYRWNNHKCLSPWCSSQISHHLRPFVWPFRPFLNQKQYLIIKRSLNRFIADVLKSNYWAV